MPRLSKAPVCFTVAQMRFNAVLSLQDKLPALQEALRQAGYPDYEAISEKAFELKYENDGLSVNQKIAMRYVFRNKQRTAAIILDEAALTYELSDYPVFEEFSQAFIRALEIVHEHRPIDYTDRLGMRMLDAIQPVKGETLEQYVVPQALGLAGIVDSPWSSKHSLSESIFKHEQRTLVIRTTRAERGLLFPPDIAPPRLTIGQRFRDHEGESITLDTDCFQEERADFSTQAAAKDLQALKAVLSSSFKNVVTEHALTTWT